MGCKTLINLLCISSILFTLGINVVQAGSIKSNLNFGSIAVTTETTKEASLDLAMKNPGSTAWDIRVEKPLASDTGVSLPAERIGVIENGNTHKLSATPSRINSIQSIARSGVTAYSLHFAVNLSPEDPPGVYRALVKISPEGEHEETAEAQSTEVTITCEVAKWFLLSAPTGELTLKAPIAPGSTTIANQQPYYLQLAANAPWKLYVSLGVRDAHNNRLKDVLQVRLNPADTQAYHGIYPDGVVLSTEPVLIAQGLSTVSGEQCWIKLPIFLEIENYIQVPAGKYELPLYFVILESKP